MDIYELIDKAKRQLGSNKIVAEQLNINAQRLSDWKHDRRKPEPAEILQLANIAGLNPAETLFQIMEKLDKDNAELWRIWRPYGDSNPGYRRERGVVLLPNLFVMFCNLVLIGAKRLNIRASFQGLSVHSVGLFLCQNAQEVGKHDRAERLALSKN